MKNERQLTQPIQDANKLQSTFCYSTELFIEVNSVSLHAH